MAYRPRRRYRRRQPVKVRRLVGRRYRRKAIGVRSRSGFVYITRKAQLMTIGSSNVAGLPTNNDPTGTCVTLGAPEAVAGLSNTYNVPFAMKFRLNQLINFTDITNLCDQYKIVAALVKIHCNWNNTNTANNVLGQPYITYGQDYDDGVVPTNVAALREKMGVKTKYFTASKPYINMGVRPCITFDVNAAGATGLAVPKRSWINSSFANVDHFGIKGVIHNWFLAATPIPSGSLFDIEVMFKVVAKDIQ